MGVFGGSPGARYFRRGRPRALPPRRGWCRGARARRFRRAARRLRSTRTQRRRRGAADAPLQREHGGCFRDGVWCGGSCRSCPETSWRGAAVVRSGGLPQGFLCGFFVQSPGRSRTAARRVRGAAEACVSSRRLRVGLSLPCSLALWPLAFWLTLPLDLDLTCLQRRRYHKEHLQLKRCRALSSAHDNDFHILLQQICSAPQP